MNITTVRTEIDPQLKKSIQQHNLRYISDATPGFSRVKKGKGFMYVDAENNRITDRAVLGRIQALKIPPAWTDVWISPSESGHVQATGRDEKGRKQYLYHADWVKMSQENKFHKMLFMGQVLPTLRQTIQAHLHEKGITPHKVLATVVWLLDNTYIRIGNQEYTKQNKSYGLTTLRNKHTEIIGNTVRFEFKGKSGVKHQVEITHPRIARIIHQLENLPGYELFQYVENRSRHLVTSEDINNYLKTITGDEITAKDFRTWGGTVLAGETLYEIGPFTNKRQLQKNITQAVKAVSKHLHNTPIVTRNYYIHPSIPENYQNNILIPRFEEFYTQKDLQTEELSVEEQVILSFLKETNY